jgi:hypothetical protein
MFFINQIYKVSLKNPSAGIVRRACFESKHKEHIKSKEIRKQRRSKIQKDAGSNIVNKCKLLLLINKLISYFCLYFCLY